MLLGAFFNIDRDVSVREREGNVLAPFGKANSVSVKIVVKAYRVELVLVIYAVHIKVKYRDLFSLVFVYERKGRGFYTRLRGEERGKAADECGLADSEIAVKSDKSGQRAVGGSL